MKISPERGRELLSYARACVLHRLGGPLPDKPTGAWCSAPAATFVTLRWAEDDALQGCIGTLEPHRSLVDDVQENAIAAAFEDPRTPPLERARDVDELVFELSILSPLEPVPFTDEASALAALRPGIDGVVFSSRGRRATFLPVMWDRLATPKAFMGALKRKAGLSADDWGDDVRLDRYTVDRHELASKAARSS